MYRNTGLFSIAQEYYIVLQDQPYFSECPSVCPTLWKPVCGFVGYAWQMQMLAFNEPPTATYANECELNRVCQVLTSEESMSGLV